VPLKSIEVIYLSFNVKDCIPYSHYFQLQPINVKNQFKSKTSLSVVWVFAVGELKLRLTGLEKHKQLLSFAQT
jgi:hypothetical protein